MSLEEKIVLGFQRVGRSIVELLAGHNANTDAIAQVNAALAALASKEAADIAGVTQGLNAAVTSAVNAALASVASATPELIAQIKTLTETLTADEQGAASLAAKVAALTDAANGGVSFAVEQALTADQQAQAQANLGLGGVDFVAAFEAAIAPVDKTDPPVVADPVAAPAEPAAAPAPEQAAAPAADSAAAAPAADTTPVDAAADTTTAATVEVAAAPAEAAAPVDAAAAAVATSADVAADASAEAAPVATADQAAAPVADAAPAAVVEDPVVPTAADSQGSGFSVG
jgi:ribonuclease E